MLVENAEDANICIIIENMRARGNGKCRKFYFNDANCTNALMSLCIMYQQNISAPGYRISIYSVRDGKICLTA